MGSATKPCSTSRSGVSDLLPIMALYDYFRTCLTSKLQENIDEEQHLIGSTATPYVLARGEQERGTTSCATRFLARYL